MHECVVHDFALEQLELVRTRQLAVEEQVGRLEEVGLFRELLDRVAAVRRRISGSVDSPLRFLRVTDKWKRRLPVPKDTLCAVDESDGRTDRGRVDKAGVVYAYARL